MLHTKFRENRPASSGNRFLGLYHIWAWRPSWSCDPNAANKISFPLPKRLHIKFGFDWPRGFGEEDLLETTTMDGRTTDHGYPINSPMSLTLR